MTRRIRISSGRYTLVSDHRYYELRKYSWYESLHGYVGRNSETVNGKRYQISMHRQILGLSKDDSRFSDHINGNKRDNRDENLRTATRLQNSHNHRIKYANNKTGYKGVYWREDSKCYRAAINTLEHCKSLGHYLGPKIAAHAYDNEARKLFGEFAAVNFPDIMTDDEVRAHRLTKKRRNWK